MISRLISLITPPVNRHPTPCESTNPHPHTSNLPPQFHHTSPPSLTKQHPYTHNLHNCHLHPSHLLHPLSMLSPPLSYIFSTFYRSHLHLQSLPPPPSFDLTSTFDPYSLPL